MTTSDFRARMASRLGLAADAPAQTVLAAFDRAATGHRPGVAASAATEAHDLYRAAWGDGSAPATSAAQQADSAPDELYEAAWGTRAPDAADRYPTGGAR